MRRLLDIDPLTGIRTYHEYDHQTKVTTISTKADVQPFLDANRREYNDEDAKRTGIKAGWWKVASIPLALITKWKAEEGIDVFDKNHQKDVIRKLQDPDYRYLRTTTGRIS